MGVRFQIIAAALMTPCRMVQDYWLSG